MFGMILSVYFGLADGWKWHTTDIITVAISISMLQLFYIIALEV